MEKEYKKIEVGGGDRLEDVAKMLENYKQNNQLVCCSFNGKMLYSDIDDIDSMFKKVTGKTKLEFDKAQEEWHKKYKEEEKKHRESIPELTKEWIEKGKNILDKKYIEKWSECVPIRLGDLYHGMELGACLEIVRELNNGCELETAKEIIEKQGHSGMSFGLVCSMIKSFCDRGTEFVNFLNKH